MNFRDRFSKMSLLRGLNDITRIFQFQAFVETEGLLPCLQGCAVGSYPESDESNILIPYSYKINFNIILKSTSTNMSYKLCDL